MRAWSGLQIVGLWLGWTVLVVAAAVIGWSRLRDSTYIAFSPPMRLPLGARTLRPAVALAVTGCIAFLLVYLPPLVVTVYWLARRRTS
jgi:hypothetical protein